ncbi:MAG TPA: NAD-dependent epimerase/dehydratase family protein [Bdellovibrionales bacterium]|nr:NAD-dependent epimerase/dehydratase family protein [Bdellovibrionales bacterium]
MRAFVTGATGFVGTHLTAALCESGHHVIALVRPSSETMRLEEAARAAKKSGGSLQLVHGDITDYRSLKIAAEECEVVYHLAALNAATRAEMQKLSAVNVEGTRNALQAAIACKAKKFVHVSSLVAIGAARHPSELVSEDSENVLFDSAVRNFETKRRAEELVREAARLNKIWAVVVNPSMIYGPGDARKAARQGNVQVARGKVPFYTSGGVNVIGVNDVVKGILAAANKGKSGERYILSSENLTMRELFAEIARAAGRPAPKYKMPAWLLEGAARISDALGAQGPLTVENIKAATMYHWCDNSKARRELDFSPAPAREAIHESVRWMKEQGLLGT